jgi:hypothetical protein
VNVRAILLLVPFALAVVRPPPPRRLFALATLARVTLEASRDRVVVVHDVDLPKGDWRGDDFDLYVAFGAPGTPRAIDARLYALDGSKDPQPNAPFEAIPFEAAVRSPANAYVLLGSPTMAGVILHVRQPAFRRAVASSGVARLRIRALCELPAVDAQSGREMVVRLGMRGAEPLAIERIEVVSREAAGWISRAEAHLCGPEADSYPLSVWVFPRVARQVVWPGPAAPALSLRHASDDLCVRFWTSS